MLSIERKVGEIWAVPVYHRSLLTLCNFLTIKAGHLGLSNDFLFVLNKKLASATVNALGKGQVEG